MSRGHGWLEQAILAELPETTPCSTASLRRIISVRIGGRRAANQSFRKRWGHVYGEAKSSRSFASSMNRALRNLEAAGKIKRANFALEGIEISGWRRPDLAQRRKSVAYHEAGHAVIAHVLRYPVAKVTIKPEGSTLGSIVRGQEKRGSIRADDRIMIYLAGPIAQAEFERKPYIRNEHLRGSDRSGVRFEQDLAVHSLDWLEAKTVRMVRKHWPRIEKVAAALLRKETIPGFEILEMLSRDNT